MAVPTPRTKSKLDYARDRENRRPHFDVTCTIGRVFLDGEGDQTPTEAAMLLIARHGAPGTFRFPHEAGFMTSVTVTHDHEED
jgi:hypothetical protein